MNLVGTTVHQPPLHSTVAHNRRHKSNTGDQTHSKISVIVAMERFVCAVDNMNKVIMIPCKLMDMTAPKNVDSVPPSVRSASDLHAIYQMLIMLRKELQGVSEKNTPDIMSINVRRRSAPTTKPTMLNKAPSSLSLESFSSDVSEFENDTDSDSGKQSDSDTTIEQSPELRSKKGKSHVTLADTFRMHLCGLQSTLDELTSSANYLSNRYQSEVGFW